jgi:hypothetical protein
LYYKTGVVAETERAQELVPYDRASEVPEPDAELFVRWPTKE